MRYWRDWPWWLGSTRDPVSVVMSPVSPMPTTARHASVRGGDTRHPARVIRFRHTVDIANLMRHIGAVSRRVL
jgi:hypothetical protein